MYTNCSGGYKTIFVLTQLSIEFQLLTKTILLKNKELLGFKHSDVVFIMLINDKMPTIVCIFTFMSVLILCSDELRTKKIYNLGACFYYSLLQVLVTRAPTPVRTLDTVKSKTKRHIIIVNVQTDTQDTIVKVRFYLAFIVYL